MADAFAFQPSLLAAVHQVQANAGSPRIRLQAFDGGAIQGGCGVEQVDRAPVGMRGELLHAGDERRDADPRADPDLPRLPVGEVEAAVRPLHRDGHPDLQFRLQAPGVVTQGLGDEGDAPLIGMPC